MTQPTTAGASDQQPQEASQWDNYRQFTWAEAHDFVQQAQTDVTDEQAGETLTEGCAEPQPEWDRNYT